MKIEVTFLTIMVLAGLFLAGCSKQQAVSETTGDILVGNTREFTIEAKQWDFVPSTITVNQGDLVRIKIKSIDVSHGFALPDFNVDKLLNPDEEVIVEFIADKKGTFNFFCSVQCGLGHGGMRGQLIVR